MAAAHHAQGVNGGRDLGAVGGDDAALAAGDVLRRVQREAGRLGEAADLAAAVRRLDGVGGVLDDGLGTAPRIPQDHTHASEFPQRSPADGLIDWTRSSEEIGNFIRAQTRPYPGAFTIIEGKRVTIWDADVVDA